MGSYWETSNRLYNLLKKPLRLSPKCTNFTLHVDFNGPTTVTQESLVDDEVVVEKKELTKDNVYVPEHTEAYKSSLTGNYYDSLEDMEQKDAEIILMCFLKKSNITYGFPDVKLAREAWDNLGEEKRNLLLQYIFTNEEIL